MMARPTNRTVLVGVITVALGVAAVILAVVDFVRIDGASHSASDTLMAWLPQVAAIGAVAAGLGFGVRRLLR
jgi:hypothetical protein